MSKSLSAESFQVLLPRANAVLDGLVCQRSTMTYLEFADALAMPGPHRIHKTTRLLERLMKLDVQSGRLPRAALIVSRVGRGLPAAGFFDRACRLGLFDGIDPVVFHRNLLRGLYEHKALVDGAPGLTAS